MLSVLRDGVAYRIVSDITDSVRLVVNAETGDVAQQIDYNSFGRIINDTNPGFQPFGFQGGLHDPATGLVRFGARKYDPQTARWLSKDPIGIAGGLNQYVACGNNPVNFVDPYGLFWEEAAFWNPNSAVGRQFVSIGDAFGAGAAGAWGWFTMDQNMTAAAGQLLQESASNSGWAILDEEGAGTGAQVAYGGALAVSATATAIAGGAMLTQGIVSEIGAKAFSNSQWSRLGLEGLTNYQKGLHLIKTQGLLRAALPTGRGLLLGAGSGALSQGPTAAAWVGGPPAVAIAGRLVYGQWVKPFGK